MVIIDVIMVLLIVIFNVDKVNRCFLISKDYFDFYEKQVLIYMILTIITRNDE
jgi:hypothetical protein